MGLSVAKDELYYIYVLRVEEDGWYVGSTQNFERRMRSHFGKGGAVATKVRRALAIEEVFELRDYQIRTDCAHERAEVLVAQRYAKLYGMNSVRGAKHGKGWDDQPSPGNLRDIDRYNRFATLAERELLLAALRSVDPATLLPKRLNGALSSTGLLVGKPRCPATDHQARAARQKAIDSARASVELEGFILSSEVEAINRRYIGGELTGDEHIAAIRAAILGG
jgi:predicted GIY-YIG superfamily endonuclease